MWTDLETIHLSIPGKRLVMEIEVRDYSDAGLLLPRDEHPTPNIQHPPPNGASVRPRRIGCWMFRLFLMDLRHLRYFQAVAEELSYSRAAERLRIAQPALSRAVQEVEAELGSPMLERNRRSVRLTPAGKVLLREAAIISERWDEGMRRVRRTATGEEGELRIGYIGPPIQPFFGRLLHEYRTRYPRVSLHLEERTPERVWEMLAKGRLSVAFTRPVTSSDALGLRTHLLRQE